MQNIESVNRMLNEYEDFESVEDCFAPVLKTITESFQLNEEKNKELYETYYSKPEISYDDNSKQLTLKKKSLIIFDNDTIKNNFYFLKYLHY